MHVENERHNRQSKDYDTRDNQIAGSGLEPSVDRRRSSVRSHRRQISMDSKSNISLGMVSHDGSTCGAGYTDNRSPRSSRHYEDQIGHHSKHPDTRHEAQDTIGHKKMAPVKVPERLNPILRVQHPSGSINEEPVSPTIDVYRPPTRQHPLVERQSSAEESSAVAYRPRTAVGHGSHTLPRGAPPPRPHHHNTPIPFDNQFCVEHQHQRNQQRHSGGGGGPGTLQHHHNSQTNVTVLHEDVYPSTVEREPPFVDIYATHPPQYLRKQFEGGSSDTQPEVQQSSFHNKGKLIIFFKLILNVKKGQHISYNIFFLFMIFLFN